MQNLMVSLCSFPLSQIFMQFLVAFMVLNSDFSTSRTMDFSLNSYFPAWYHLGLSSGKNDGAIPFFKVSYSLQFLPFLRHSSVPQNDDADSVCVCVVSYLHTKSSTDTLPLSEVELSEKHLCKIRNMKNLHRKNIHLIIKLSEIANLYNLKT